MYELRVHTLNVLHVVLVKEQGSGGFLSQRDSAVVWAFWLQCQVRRLSELLLFILGKFTIQRLFNEPHTVEEIAFLNRS